MKNLKISINLILILLLLSNTLVWGAVEEKASIERRTANDRPTGSDRNSSKLPEEKTQTGISGVLRSPDAKSVLVNGSPAQNGMTVFSGTMIKTTGSGVQISISGIGQVVLGPNSEARLTFSETGIGLVLTSGSVSVLTFKGKLGQLTDPTGSVSKSEIEAETSILKYPDDGREAPLIIENKPVISTIGWIAIAGGALAGIIVPVTLSISNTQPN